MTIRRHVTAAFAVMALAACATAPASDTAPVTASAAAPAFQITNIADDFLAFWDSTTQLPTAERVTIFKRDIAPLFPQFYGVERFGGRTTQDEQDARIATAIEAFASLRDRYATKVASFDADLARNIASFTEEFPAFEAEVPIYLVHALGEMDGGPRTLSEKEYLIFGADVMTRAHPFQDESAFFHHELFHLHHVKTFNCREVWCTLWTEGLAVYVAHQMNPTASEAQLLLDFPPGMVAATEAKAGIAWSRLGDQLKSTDPAVLATLFQGRPNESGLPPRHGYYLGYAIARELGRTRDLRELTALTEEQAWPLISATVAEMRGRHPAPGV